MSYPRLAAAQHAPAAPKDATRYAPAPLLRAAAPEALARHKPLTRRYEASWLNASGTIEHSTRIAPAIALFEEAFSALARGALILTETGPIAVEDLQPGMRALTAEGRVETITWIGSITLYPGTSSPETTTNFLTRITAEAFGFARPASDLLLGPRARLLLQDKRCRAIAGSDSAYVPAQAFVDGVSVIELRPSTPVTVFHLALQRQGSLRTTGMEVESYHPSGGIEHMTEARLLELFTALFPHISNLADFGPSAHPRLTRFEVERLLS